jgi:predicted O-methyltransferase YrrM
MDTLQYILNKFSITYDGKTKMPLDIINFQREFFPALLKELGLKNGAEIGVADGLFSERLCKELPDGHIYSVDVWALYGKEKKNYHYRDQAEVDRFYRVAYKRLSALSNCTIVKKFSLEAAENFPSESLDFVYIDADHHLKSVIEDIHAWADKVRVGGIVAGHDYARNSQHIHVKSALHAYASVYEIRPFFTFGRAQQGENAPRNKVRSWMYVKEKNKW